MNWQTPLFGWMMGAVGADGDSDLVLYREMLSDARLGHRLGYDAAWLVEHHFSDYYPTPSPMVFLSHIAARCPGFGLGTAVIVTPWHHPLRIAEEIAMLSLVTDGPIRIGLGRGNAPLEYEAYGVEMSEAKDRFEECWEIVQLALKAKPFTYKGKYLSVPREVVIRPTPRLEQVTFHGAIGQPSSAGKIADLGLPPMLTGHTPLPAQQQVLEAWDAAAKKRGMSTDACKLCSPITILADTDREAVELARKYVPNWYKLQVEHYAFDAEKYANLPTYLPFTETHKRRLVYCDPDALGPLLEWSFVGSAKTVRKKVEQYLGAGFNYVMVNPSLPGLPHALRQDWLTRFGRDVMPHFAAGQRRAGNGAEPRVAAQ
jgi:alkanesulfonate monooxygenase SsuD/methylene tetrahydromethanopterin reductase-like flavin-dependent oxidoreductase (luciferase family)